MTLARPFQLSGIAIGLVLLLSACQQTRPVEPDTVLSESPAAAGTDCTASPADWLSSMPAQQRRILPADCSSASPGALLFSWGSPGDRNGSIPFGFTVRSRGGAQVMSRSDLSAPRFILEQGLPAGDYEWAVSYTNQRGVSSSSQWRRFRVEAPVMAAAMLATDGSSNSKALSARSAQAAPQQAIPDGATLSHTITGKARPRLLPAGSSFAGIAAASRTPENVAVLDSLRASARFALSQPLPAAPLAVVNPTALQVSQLERSVHQTSRSQRAYIETLSVIGRIDNNAAMLASAKQRLMALASWAPDGVSGEKINDHANREIYLALATGIDLIWDSLTATERAQITASLRTRTMQASEALAYLDREPYESHRLTNVRGINQALLLAAGMPGFPEAQGLLARNWDLSRFTLGAWGDKDGSFGNGIAYGWYAFINTVPYVAAVRSITGVDLYQLPVLRRAGEQLIAFTAPHHRQPSAFGDGAEVADHYVNYASNYYRLHAQMTRDPVDAWYWQVNPANLSRTNEPQIWQLLMLGVDSSPLPRPQAPTRNSWFFPDAGLAAVHSNSAQSARSSLFFRASRFGAFNHSHADQNSLVYVSQGQPLLINAGYYPYYNSPHHKSVTRATRYKNALTFDGGFGQSESRLGATRPSDPLHSMDASGELLRAEERGQLTLLTGDATLAYRAVNPATGTWVPLLNNAVRSVVVDRANGLVFVYDWATSTTPRRWELNYHSPNAFSADAATVRASNGSASVCLDRHGPASSFAQTMAWDVAPEVSQPAQAHGRFTLLNPTTELAHLTVLREGCRIQPLQVQQQGTRIQVTLGAQTVVFDKRSVSVP
ncbi:heparinase II/III family protein [Kinneretia asaccharophila]|uniref:Heparinase II/III-like protein n=1 Tax=Roseateles asaccharophilus TaxID=582607 RepID=A0A4R6MYQ4_9BURK|nr:heparinase II/III family protein [Roseateles asaccharophilus]MDN3545609.1 heparinase II/III family protein [Roseateles asaccharophilus]TDP07477.1 heparinase II/III-like protein [Roseateles asaccharophilus]